MIIARAQAAPEPLADVARTSIQRCPVFWPNNTRNSSRYSQENIQRCHALIDALQRDSPETVVIFAQQDYCLYRLTITPAW